MPGRNPDFTDGLPQSMDHLRQIGKNISGVVLRRLLTMVMSFGILFGLARWLGVEGLGQYNLAIFFPSMLMIFLNLGISQANVYHIGQNRANLRLALRTVLVIWLMLTLVGLLTGTLLVTAFSTMLFPGVPVMHLWVALPIFPILLLQSYFFGILQGLQVFDRLNHVTILVSVLNLALIVVGAMADILTVAFALSSYMLSQLAGTVLAGFWLFRFPTLTGQADVGSIWVYAIRIVCYGWILNVSNVIVFLNYRIDIFLINLFLNPTAVGLYSAAVRVVEVIWMPSTAVGQVLLPRIAELKGEEAIRKLITPLVARWTLLLSSTISLVIMIAGPMIFRLMGDVYLDSYLVLVLLLPGALLITHSRVIINDIAARGFPQYHLYTTSSVFIIETLLLVLLLTSFDLAGAAIASSIAYSTQVAIGLYFYSRLTGLGWTAVLKPSQLDKHLIVNLIHTVQRLRRSA